MLISIYSISYIASFPYTCTQIMQGRDEQLSKYDHMMHGSHCYMYNHVDATPLCVNCTKRGVASPNVYRHMTRLSPSFLPHIFLCACLGESLGTRLDYIAACIPVNRVTCTMNSYVGPPLVAVNRGSLYLLC